MSGFGMILLYIIEKLKINTRYKKPEQLSAFISLNFLSTTKIGIVCYIITNYILNGKGTIKDIAIMFIGILLSLLPYELFRKKYIAFEDFSSIDMYEDRYFSFGSNYEIENPVTKKLGETKYLNKMVEKNIINKEEKEEYLAGKNSSSNVVELYHRKIGKDNKYKLKLFKKFNNYLQKNSFTK